MMETHWGNHVQRLYVYLHEGDWPLFPQLDGWKVLNTHVYLELLWQSSMVKSLFGGVKHLPLKV